MNTIGFINKTGKLAIPFRYSNAENFDKDGYLYAYKDDGRNNSINCLVESNGKETVLAPLSSTGLKNDGIYSRSGKLVCKANFIHVSEFSEGLAAVAKQDEFGQTKWGFIDEHCNTVVPFQFSKMPGKFSQGLAMVTPLSNSGFDYAYIDRTGKLVIKLTKDKNMENVGQSMDPSPYAFNDGNFAISPFKDQITNTDYLLFKTGVHVSYANLLKSNGATFNLRDVAIEECSNSQILFRCRLTKGISSMDGKIIVQPVFNELSSFDPESKLAKAKYSTGNNTYTEGYINEQGVFVIIKGGASTW